MCIGCGGKSRIQSGGAVTGGCCDFAHPAGESACRSRARGQMDRRPNARRADNLTMRLFANSHPHPLRRRLWLGGTWLGLVVATFVIMQALSHAVSGSHLLSFGGDFVPAYAAGTLVREGRAVEVYDEAALGEAERRVVREADLEPLPLYGAYLNPPFFAAAYAPL